MNNIKKIRLIRNIIVILIVILGLAMCIFIHMDYTKEYKEIKEKRIKAGEHYAKEVNKQRYSKITDYIGDKVKGSEVKQMIADTISMNSSNVENEGNFISIEVEGSILNFKSKTSGKAVAITNFKEGDKLAESCAAANSYDGGENTSENVNTATAEMYKLVSKINSNKKYEVVADYVEEYKVIRIYIGEIEK
ncbi:MAG: hypothetical protein ACI4VN_01250 [Clostridia bacterium]